MRDNKIGGTHLNFFYLKQFPILPPAFYTATRLDFIVPRVLELTYTSHSMAPFARDLGYDGPPFAGTRTAARSCAPSSTPGTPSPTASPATNSATSSTPRT